MKLTKLITILTAILIMVPAAAQTVSTRTVSGKVVDSKTSEPLVGAIVRVKNSNTYSSCDFDGNFSLNLPSGTKTAVVEVSLIGYKTEEVAVSAGKNVSIPLIEDSEMLNEVQVIAYGTQSKMSVTGSMASVSTKELLKSPSGSAAASLAGAVTGISSVQISGQPGAEDPDIFVRGTGSLTDNASKPLILVDGVERSFFQMDPNEIENITVLKDAASTAVFGVRGANGVILVTTRRGEAGKTHLSVDSSFGITQALRNLDGVDSYHYGLLYNEAMKNDDPNIAKSSLKFSDYILERFRLQDEPILFPSINWEDYIFKDFAWQTHHNVNISGGDKDVQYFVSLGYLHEDGIVKQYYEPYNSNFRYDRFNYRANVDANITRTTKLSLGIGGRMGTQYEPVSYDGLWQNIMWCIPFAGPGIIDGVYVNNGDNGYLSMAGSSDGLSLYYNWGYDANTTNTLNLDGNVRQDLGFITKGLSASIKGAYNTSYNVSVHRTPVGTNSGACAMYLGTLTTPGLSMEDPAFDRTIILKTDNVTGLHERMTYSSWTGQGRNWYLEGSINYSRTFKGDHEVTGLLLYNQSKSYYPGQYQDIPTAYVGYVGRATYAYKKRYLLDVNAGYNGSENFAPERRYGFFPSGSIGWIISEEPWMKSQKTIDFLKLRASYGLVGNDKYSGSRFLYLKGAWDANHNAHTGGSWGWGVWGTYQFGDGSSNTLQPEAIEGMTGNDVVSWEKCLKQNYGLDLKMFNYKLSLTADFFYEHRWDILSYRNTLPGISSVKLPLINLGIVDNHGYEISLGWTDKIAGAVKYNLVANVSYSKNKIVFMDEVVPNEPYMAQTGLSTGLNYGYIFDRYLTPDDFDSEGHLITGNFNSDGTFEGTPVIPLESARPGDAMYKDLNGDGEINTDDCTYFGHAYRPDYTIGFVNNFSYKGWSLSLQWTAALGASRMLTGGYRNAFGDTNSRMVLKYLADYRSCEENGWQGTFPRMTLTGKSWNQMNSTIWLMDASYLRLKTVELSYTFDQQSMPWLKKAGMSAAKLYFNAYNAFTLFSQLTQYDIDPEGRTGDGDYVFSYPNNRIFNIGINLNF